METTSKPGSHSRTAEPAPSGARAATRQARSPWCSACLRRRWERQPPEGRSRSVDARSVRTSPSGNACAAPSSGPHDVRAHGKAGSTRPAPLGRCGEHPLQRDRSASLGTAGDCRVARRHRPPSRSASRAARSRRQSDRRVHRPASGRTRSRRSPRWRSRHRRRLAGCAHASGGEASRG